VRYHYQMMTATTRDPYAPVDPAIERRAEEIMLRPYRKIISGDAEQGFLIQVPDLPGCMTAGDTEVEAVTMLPEAMMAWLTVALEDGLPIPEPTPEPTHSGRVLVRMPKTLHQRLAEQAEVEGVSLNQLAVAILARGLR
jgi:antitoxin HicB